MYCRISGSFLFVLLVAKCELTNTLEKFTGLKDISGYSLDIHEIQRQNQITKQILQNFLEKRLFGQNKSSKPPSLWEILPRNRRKMVNNIQDALNGTNSGDKETLESGESERISAYEDYEDNDGKK